MDLLQAYIKKGFKLSHNKYFLHEVQQWLQETKNIKSILVIRAWKSTIGTCYKCQYVSDGMTFTTKKECDTYDDALEDGLKHQLMYL